MFTTDSLLEIHRRTHAGTIGLLDHCAQFNEEELFREHDGFGYPTMVGQLDHLIGAEWYWVTVIKRAYDQDEMLERLKKRPLHRTIAELREFRDDVFAATVDYLKDTPQDRLNIKGEFLGWPNEQKTLIPALVVARFTTHAFQHRGQVAAMCRIMDKPIPPLDLPLEP